MCIYIYEYVYIYINFHGSVVLKPRVCYKCCALVPCPSSWRWRLPLTRHSRSTICSVLVVVLKPRVSRGARRHRPPQDRRVSQSAIVA